MVKDDYDIVKEYDRDLYFYIAANSSLIPENYLHLDYQTKLGLSLAIERFSMNVAARLIGKERK